MKKTAAILLLILFLFNIAGYKAVSFYLSQKADHHMEARLAEASFHENLVTFKIPLQLPYLTDQNDFEPADGEINVRGEIYKLVKKKISRDTLFVICIDHKEKTRIAKNDNDYFKKINDLTTDNSKKSDIKPIKADYLPGDQYTPPAPSVAFQKTSFSRYFLNDPLAGHLPEMASPPEYHLS